MNSIYIRNIKKFFPNKFLFQLIIVIILFIIIINYTPANNLPPQVDIDRAQHVFDDKGIPLLRVNNLGEVYNPAWVAIYALQYAGFEIYSKSKLVDQDLTKFQACISWLVDHLKMNELGDKVWFYQFDNTYNDITVKAPWYSAFGQAVGIEALLTAFELDGQIKYLDLAKEAAAVLFRPINDGGVLFQQGDDIWFEEVASPTINPPHILNGHMRTLIALKKLANATDDQQIKTWYERGLNTLRHWLPLYDTGYWLRYDLNPRKTDLLFRITNPYGFKLAPLAIDKITLRDPISGKEVTIDVGSIQDSQGELRIAGNDWSQPEILDNRTVRRLNKVTPATYQEELDGGMYAPNTYFYLKLPSEWKDNLRTEWFELILEYKDETPGNLTIQMRSIFPGVAFRDMRDGDLMLTGSRQWRQWIIPVRTTDLGFWVGELYADKHNQYLNTLSSDLKSLSNWVVISQSYINFVKPFSNSEDYFHFIAPDVLPKQSPFIGIFSFDQDGVVRGHIASENSKFDGRGMWLKGDIGIPVYTPYLIAQQALLGKFYWMPPAMNLMDVTTLVSQDQLKYYNFVTFESRNQIKKKPAYKWLSNNAEVVASNGLVWRFPFVNIYNDVVTLSPWQSAFSQAYVIKALSSIASLREDQDSIVDASQYEKLLLGGLSAYDIDVVSGGLSTHSKEGFIFFEEVPNGTHVLNSHLISLTVLKQFNQQANIQKLYDNGLYSLKNLFYKFDTGYWLKYDQNPKKEILFQLDWLQGNKSPLINEIIIQDLGMDKATHIDVGSQKGFDGYPNIAGSDWLATENVDGKSVRDFQNGYLIRDKPVEGGTTHNVYFSGVLPEKNFIDYFDVKPLRLIIRYKDVSVGEFCIKIQAINEGNFLKFIPLRNGILKTQGDGKWKEAIFIVRPQDMGWYVGPDYQKFHVEQLNELAKQTNDWFFSQNTEKNQYFFDANNQGYPVIIQPKFEPNKTTQLIDVAPSAIVVASTATYNGYEVDNALDGNAENNYAAGLDSIPLPHSFTLAFSRTVNIHKIELIWESNENFATDYTIDNGVYSGDLPHSIQYKTIVKAVDQSGMHQLIDLTEPVPSVLLRFTINKTHSQPRLLLRQIRILTLP